jgi:uncharacterized membrane protein AbrB (regulator of aidB expression)
MSEKLVYRLLVDVLASAILAMLIGFAFNKLIFVSEKGRNIYIIVSVSFVVLACLVEEFIYHYRKKNKETK